MQIAHTKWKGRRALNRRKIPGEELGRRQARQLEQDSSISNQARSNDSFRAHYCYCAWLKLQPSSPYEPLVPVCSDICTDLKSARQ